MPLFDRLRLATWKLLRLGPRGWWLLVEAQIGIIWAALLVRQRARGELFQYLETADPAAVADPADLAEVEEIGLAIDRVARVGFGRPLCLVRSLALQNLLVRRGVSGSRIRVGVRFRDGTFEAHAWVEWNGMIVGEDSAHVERFRTFSDLGARPLQLSRITPT